jgi:mRNA-degrading endonuclease toxin of MazEF toxin-antitoxin module
LAANAFHWFAWSRLLALRVRDPPLAAGESGLAKKSFALIDHLRSVDKRRVRSVFGEVGREEIAAIDEGWRSSSASASGSTTRFRRRSSNCR